MQITRESDYAIRCVIHLSGDLGKAVTVAEIADAMVIPRSFLAKILQRLVKSGIVSSTRGVKGGFQLKRKPADISLLDVITAIEGPYALNICASGIRNCKLRSSCPVHPVWTKIRGEVKRMLEAYSFKELAAWDGKDHGTSYQRQAPEP